MNAGVGVCLDESLVPAIFFVSQEMALGSRRRENLYKPGGQGQGVKQVC